MRKRLLALLASLAACCLHSYAQVDIDAEFFSLPQEVTDAYLDSVDVKATRPNNYWMAGVYGGAGLLHGFFNPPRNVAWPLVYPVYGFSFTRYYTMFGIFSNMGLEFGAQQNYEGYEFAYNKETKYRMTESGAYKAVMKVPEVFFLSHFHYDMGDHFRLMVKAGIFGGYRTEIARTLEEGFEYGYSQYQYIFRDYDIRPTYGVQGGAGFAVMIDPFELHVNVQVKWGWSSFWQPNYVSPYYYRFAYPLDGALTFGLYYQLTPRKGHSRHQLRKMARQMVESFESDNADAKRPANPNGPRQ